MRVALAFLVWLFNFWTWKAFFLRWVHWSPPSPYANGETAREEHLPSPEGQQESELSRFLSSSPEDVGWHPLLSFEDASKVAISYGRRRFEVLHGTDLHSGYRELLGSVASSKNLFREGLQLTLRSEECCKHLEAFGDALRQSDHVLRKLNIACVGGSAIQFAKCVSSVVQGNDNIQNLYIGFHDVKGIMGKVGATEFMAIIASLDNLRILKSFQFYFTSLDGEAMEQLILPFKCPHSHSVLKVFKFNSLTSDVQFEHISSMLVTNTSLKTLYIDSKVRKVFVRGYTSLAVALCSNQSLKTLRCGISSSTELKALLDPLLPKNINAQCNTTVTKLQLWGNIGGKEGIEPLVDMLRTNSSLLELQFVRICESSLLNVDDILAILEALKTNKSLKRIDFSWCSGIGGYKVLGAMMDLLLENHCIEDINLNGTRMARSGDVQYVYSALAKRREMKLWDIVQGMANVNPTSGRVFLCGEPYR